MNKCMMPDFLQRCEGAVLCEHSHGDDSETWWCSFCADRETNPSAAFLCHSKAELCACWEAGSKQMPGVCDSQTLCSTEQYSADEYTFFSVPPPLQCCTEIRFSYHMMQNLSVGRSWLQCKYRISWAAQNWNNPTPSLSFSPKSHPASHCGDWGGLTAGGGDTEDLSPKIAGIASGWWSGFWSLYLLECQPSCRSYVYLAMLSLLLLLISLSSLNTNIVVIIRV